MRANHLGVVLALATACSLSASFEGLANADEPKGKPASKPWCSPEVTELSDHVCFFDGGAPEDGRHTLVVYLHGALAMTPGFQYMQQGAMALHAKRHHFTVLIPTAPSDGVGYVWPTSQTAQKDQEPGILAGLKKARADVEKRVGHKFDETFVVGFSSVAYYGSSLAVRSALDVDGYIVLAGGSSWVRNDKAAGRRAPVFVGVSAADPQTAAHSRAFGGSLATMGWPAKVEERNAGHMVDWTFMAHGIAWLREKKAHGAAALQTVSNAN
ncbi:MAG TPA: hypothetical protein VLT33_26040 [Labilithrix sp.]|nr:hypothetical protein [Labilithrix sp.]